MGTRAAPALPARRCKAKNRQGKPCRSTSLKPDGYCSAHTRLVTAGDRFGSVTQARAAATGVRRRYPRLHEVMEARIEAKAEEIVSKGLEALEATVMQVDKHGDEHFHPDYFTRLRAFDVISQRGLGKPEATTNVHADLQGVVGHLNLADDQAREHLAGLLRARPVKPSQ